MTLKVEFFNDPFVARCMAAKGAVQVAIYSGGGESQASYLAVTLKHDPNDPDHTVESRIPDKVSALPGYCKCTEVGILSGKVVTYVVFASCDELGDAFQT